MYKKKDEEVNIPIAEVREIELGEKWMIVHYGSEHEPREAWFSGNNCLIEAALRKAMKR